MNMAEMNLAIVIQAIDNATSAIKGVTNAVEGMKRSVESVKNSAAVASEGLKGIQNAAVTAATAASYLRQRFETAFQAINRAATWVIGSLVAGFYSTIRLGDEFSRLETLFGIPADVAFVWKKTLEELDINFDNFVSGARSLGRGLMYLERMMTSARSKAAGMFFSPQTIAVLNQMVARYRELSRQGADYLTISVEIARMLNRIANEGERMAVAQMLFRQAAYEALGIARLPAGKLRETQAAWRQIAPSREQILQADEMGDQLRRTLASVQVAFMQFILENKDLILDLLKAIRDAINGLRQFAKEHPQLFKFLSKAIVFGAIFSKIFGFFFNLGKVFGGLRIGGFLGRLLSLGRILSWLVTIFRLVAAAIGAVVGGISLPVLAIIAVVLILIAIGIWVYKNWDKVKKFLLDTWNKIKEAWEKLVNFLKEKWNAFKEWVSGIWEKMKEAGRKIVEGIKKGIEEKWEALKAWFKDKLQKLRNLLPFSEPKDPTSPLRMLHQSGKAIITSVGEGIRQSSAMLHETFVRALQFNIPAMRLPTPIPTTPAGGFGGYHVYTFHVVTDRQLDERVEDFMQNRLPQILRMLATGR